MQGIVSGALNVDTGEFKTWAEYTATEGQNPNQAFHFATGPWQTFFGECMLKPKSTWWERSYTSFGSWVENKADRRRAGRSRINVKFAGFTTKTSMPSWRARCEDRNVDAMATRFRTMPGLPSTLISIWDGLERRYKERIPMTGLVPLEPRQAGRVIGTTALQVVHAVQVFRVDRWFWHNDQDSGVATTWRGLGPAWKQVYSATAFVEARGLSQQFPKNRWRSIPKTEDDLCVNLGNKQIVNRRGVPVRSRAEL